MMHFHNFGKCMNCMGFRSYSTPIPNILVLSSTCDRCGWNDMVGMEAGQVCIPCREQWKADVEREHMRRLTETS
jgi:hypothetical protein